MSTSSLVDDLDRLANRPRSVLQREYWFPLGVFGVLSLVATLVFDRWDPSETASWVYWAILGPLGGILTSVWFARRSNELGIHDGHRAVYLAGYGACVIGCSLAGALVPEPWTYPAVFGVVGGLNLVLGLLFLAAAGVARLTR